MINAPIVICRDCCRVIGVTDLVPDANMPPGRCPFCVAEGKSGDACDCRDCMASISALQLGCWRSAGLQARVAALAVSWTPEGGLVCRNNP